MLERGLWLKSPRYHLSSLLSVISEVFENPMNKKLVDHLWKYGVLTDFQYGFRSSQSTANLQTVVSDRIARIFNRFQAIRAVILDIS